MVYFEWAVVKQVVKRGPGKVVGVFVTCDDAPRRLEGK